MRALTAVCISLLLCSYEASGCSSFAWYGPETPLYGMNFDWYPDCDIVFAISEGENGRVFTMSFREGEDDPVATVGMNAAGLFATMQVIDAEVRVGEAGPDEEMIWMPFYYGLWEASGFSEVEAYVKHVPLVQYRDIPLHLLIADPSGEAMIVETGEAGNQVVDIGDEEFLVMTNFSCTTFAGRSPEEVSGCGEDRYRAVHAMLSEATSLDPPGAMDVLEAALNTNSGSPTRASMVFDPVSSEVYIAVEGEMDTVWRIGLSTGTVVGVRGLPQGLSYPIPEEGISSDELMLRTEG